MNGKKKSRELRQQEIEGIIEGSWAALHDERKETHEPTQSSYRFCSVFLAHFAALDYSHYPPVADCAELRYFNNQLLRFLDGLSLTTQERGYILGTLFERLCTSIVRPHKLGM